MVRAFARMLPPMPRKKTRHEWGTRQTLTKGLRDEQTVEGIGVSIVGERFQIENVLVADRE
jgi:hypothetical protein